MADHIELAKAYVTIVPTTTGMGNALTRELNGASAAAGTSAGNSFGDRFASTLGAAGKVAGAAMTAIAGATTAAVGAAATGVVNLTTQSVQAYSEFEQLTGGISKLYGTAGQSLEEYANSLGDTDLTMEEIEDQFNSLARAEEMMAQNAQEAYATAGMSANEYMQSVTGFSAALINSLGGDTEEAARIADIAMRDLSDNANTFGVQSAQELANIYGALARGSFQTLDSLNLGFAGTQQGMIDLINASGIFETQIDSLENVSFDQMLLAIHAVQENMGIAGTTANEAMGTIQGSIGMLQGAWTNLLTGMGDAEADLSGLIDNVVTSALAVVDNIAPVAEQAMGGIAQLIDGLAPVLEDHLPSMIESLLPSLLSAVTSIITSVANALPTIASVLLPQVSNVIRQVLPTILSLVPSFISIGGEIISAVITGLIENAEEITEAGLGVLQTLIDSFAEAANGDGLSQLVDTTMLIIQKLGEFLVLNLPTIMGTITELISQLVIMFTTPENQVMMMDLALQLILAVADGLVQAIPNLVSVIPQLIAANIQSIGQLFPMVLEFIGQLLGDLALMVLGLVGGLMGDSYEEVMSSLEEVWDFVSQSFDDAISGLGEWIGNIGENISALWEDIKEWFSGGVDTVMETFDDWWDSITEWFGNLADNALTWAGDLIDNFVSGLTSGISVVEGAVSGIADSVRSFLGFSEPEKGPLSNFHTYAPDMIDLFNEGIEDSTPELEATLNRTLSVPALSSDTIAEYNPGTSVNEGGNIVIPINIGQEMLDTIIVRSEQISTYRRGS